MSQPVKINSAPGIKRDGTRLEGDNYIDGQWCRFQRGRPRKIGGYRVVTSTLPELTRGMTSLSADELQYIHLGGAAELGQYTVNNSGSFVGFNDRTPAAYGSNVNTLWQFDHFYDSVAVATDIIAHPGGNLNALDSTDEFEIYLGPVTTNSLLVASGLGVVSGGAVTIGPYLFFYGNDGMIGFSPVNNPTLSGTKAFVTQQKVVKGMSLRGAGAGPAGLFWSLDALIRASFVGGTPVWEFDTLTSDISILSSQGVVEYDGVYFWPGVDRWLMYNGVVREIPNPFNVNYFFDNLNFAHRQKVFGFKVPRFGEIWWCYPRGSATECTHAIIYNVREGYWYDTELPLSQHASLPGRTAGIFAKVYSKPFMVDADDTGGGAFTLWQHETGVDRIDGAQIDPIPSHFETAEIGMAISEQAASNAELRVDRVEPDFVQVGDMTLEVHGRANSRAPIITLTEDTVVFPATAATPTQETVKLKAIRRLMSFKFSSNTQGGDYEFGECLASIEPTGERVES